MYMCMCVCVRVRVRACVRFVVASEHKFTIICRMIVMMMVMIKVIMKTEGLRNYVIGG